MTKPLDSRQKALTVEQMEGDIYALWQGEKYTGICTKNVELLRGLARLHNAALTEKPADLPEIEETKPPEELLAQVENIDQLAGMLSTMRFSDKHPEVAKQWLLAIKDVLMDLRTDPVDDGLLDAYKKACLDSCFALDIKLDAPPENLEKALSMANYNPQKLAVYATFARHFDRAIAKYERGEK